MDTLETPDTLDTLALARLDRECQGPWEAEYSYGEEADLHRHYDNCAKNPGHENFIPVDKFSIEALPERYRDNDMLDYIRAETDLTVRVTVKYVSARRRKTVGVSDKPYPGYQCRGQRRTTVGTGWVEGVAIWTDEMGQTCTCKDCRKSSTAQTKFAEIRIHTAAHVVYDESEAEHTTCHLFFDREGTPGTCEGVVALTDMHCFGRDTESDKCQLHHYTHNLELAQRLEQRYQQRKKLRRNMKSKLKEAMNLKCRQPTPDKQPLLFIVSHPHGCSKQISIGRWTSAREQPDSSYNFTYNTATCPGSSGALVCLLQMPDSLGLVDMFSIHPIHLGVFDKQPGMNFSTTFPGAELYPHHSLKLDEDKPELIGCVYLDLMQQDEGPWEEKFACVEEEDLQKHYDTCQKNPGHQNFCPVDQFGMDNLPPFYRINEIMEMIKCVSDRTVRVSVKYVSEERPETVPGTDIPYPWRNNRGSNQLRVGSGCVTKVECFKLYNGACDCEECKSSDVRLLPKVGYANIYVETAAHLVYDELEGKHTTCHLFYDSGETPDACKGVVTLRNMCYMKTDDDTCRLMYRTHDLDLFGQREHFKHDLAHLLQNWQDFMGFMYRTQNCPSNPTPAPPLDIVVSHPHGRAKHVSIGYCGSHGNTDTEDNQCPFNSIICPGSSGAPVVSLNRTCLYPSIL